MMPNHHLLAAASLGALLSLTACNAFDATDRYRCATDDDCIAGYTCVQLVCVGASVGGPDGDVGPDGVDTSDAASPDVPTSDISLDGPETDDAVSPEQHHRILYHRGGGDAELLARDPEVASAVSVTAALDGIGWPPESDTGALSPNGAWLAFATTSGHDWCASYPCLAISSGDLSAAALVFGEAPSAPINLFGGPMDIDADASLIVHAKEFHIESVRRLAGEPLAGGAWSTSVRLDESAPGDIQFGETPVIMQYEAKDRVAWACGKTHYPGDNREICQVTLVDGGRTPGAEPPQRIKAEVLPSGAGGSLSSPRYAWIGGKARIVFIADVAEASNIWHTALDGTDPRKVTDLHVAEGEFEGLCVFAGDRGAAMLNVSGDITLVWLDLTKVGLTKDKLKTLDSFEYQDPPPRLLGCH